MSPPLAFLPPNRYCNRPLLGVPGVDVVDLSQKRAWRWTRSASPRLEFCSSLAWPPLSAGQVEDVTLLRHGIRHEGTLHLTSHHLIFSCAAPPDAPPSIAKSRKAKEIWITYPVIAFCTYRPAPPASHQAPSIRLRCRDFTYVAFHFLAESKARDVYESIKSLTCKLGRVEKLYAFSYRPQGPEKAVNGWTLYDARREWKRQGISDTDPDRGWRISEINTDYQVRKQPKQELDARKVD